MRRQATAQRGPATAVAAPPIKARRDSPSRAYCDDDPEPGATGHPAAANAEHFHGHRPQAEPDPNKNPNTTSVAGTEPGKNAHSPHAAAECRGRAEHRPVPRCAGHRGGAAARAVGDPQPRRRAADRQFRCSFDGQRYNQQWLQLRWVGAVIKSSSRRWLHSSPVYPASPAVGRAACLYIAALGVNALNCRCGRGFRGRVTAGPQWRTGFPVLDLGAGSP